MDLGTTMLINGVKSQIAPENLEQLKKGIETALKNIKPNFVGVIVKDSDGGLQFISTDRENVTFDFKKPVTPVSLKEYIDLI